MNLLFIIPEYPPHAGGGIVTFYINLLPQLARLGHRVQVLVGSALSGKMESYESAGITTEFLDHRAVTANLEKFNRYRALPELQRHLAAAWTAWEQTDGGRGYDLVETTDWGLLFVPWVIEADSPPTVVQLHGSIGQIDFYDPRKGEEMQGVFTRLLETQLLPCADELQSYSKNNANAWQRLTGREVTYIPPAWTSSLPNGKSDNDSAHGLVVGRIQYWKGPIILCEAMRLLGDNAPVIDWVGRDTTFQDSSISMSEYLTQTFPDVWGKKVCPIGPRSPEEVSKLQAKSEFNLVPSTWDVFNFTCIEGMGYGRPVLCSEGAGAAGLITNGEDGLTFTANDAAGLAKCLKRFLQMDAASRKQMGERARQMIETAVSPARIATQRLEAYDKLLRLGKHSVRPNEWMQDAVCPHQPLTDTLAFLDRLPLRKIAAYVGGRTLKKLKK